MEKKVSFTLRLSPKLRDWLAREAAKNHRSLNAEIIHRLEQTKK